MSHAAIESGVHMMASTAVCRGACVYISCLKLLRHVVSGGKSCDGLGCSGFPRIMSDDPHVSWAVGPQLCQATGLAAKPCR